MASGNACNPIIFEPMVLSILLAQQKKLMNLEQQLNDVKKRKTRAQPVEKNKL
jgi:hypothetical protein